MLYKTVYTFEIDHHSEPQVLMEDVRYIISNAIRDDDSIIHFKLIKVESEAVD